MEIKYKRDVVPHITDLLDLFDHSNYHPNGNDGDEERLINMFRNANLLVTAWEEQRLIGISRSLCDFSYCCYLSDLAVRGDYKSMGIGKELVRLTKEYAGAECKLILHSSADAVGFYKAIGMEQISDAFIIKRAK